jgi:hypothetical protein
MDLKDAQLYFILLFCVAVQVGIKYGYAISDPPRLGQDLPRDLYPSNATNPHFLCYSPSEGKFDFLNTTWQVRRSS